MSIGNIVADAAGKGDALPTRGKRSGDKVGFAAITCWTAARLSEFWDFVDKRQIDVHLMSWAVFALAGYTVYWSMEFVWTHPEKPGLEVGAIVAAINLPITPVLAKVVDWYFKARA